MSRADMIRLMAVHIFASTPYRLSIEESVKAAVKIWDLASKVDLERNEREKI